MMIQYHARHHTGSMCILFNIRFSSHMNLRKLVTTPQRRLLHFEGGHKDMDLRGVFRLSRLRSAKGHGKTQHLCVTETRLSRQVTIG